MKKYLKAFAIALLAGTAFAAVLFLAGLLLKGGAASAGLELAKDGIFLALAVLLFLLAGLVLRGGSPKREMERGTEKNSAEKSGTEKGSTEKGSKDVPRAPVRLIVLSAALAFLILAAVLDYIQFYFT